VTSNDLLEYYELLRIAGPLPRPRRRRMKILTSENTWPSSAEIGNRGSFCASYATVQPYRHAVAKLTVWKIQHPGACRESTRHAPIRPIVAISAFRERRKAWGPALNTSSDWLRKGKREPRWTGPSLHSAGCHLGFPTPVGGACSFCSAVLWKSTRSCRNIGVWLQGEYNKLSYYQ
jgi:hypothetical protein